ncbi:hypothetical protein [Flavobacterium sp.]|uniref:hypothetical protein n=1 Tax=Flavobacterium sp. TaxID=239 RepID=UPI002620F290|nr:hypothetical protein [Flavobacterium sp.]
MLSKTFDLNLIANRLLETFFPFAPLVEPNFEKSFSLKFSITVESKRADIVAPVSNMNVVFVLLISKGNSGVLPSNNKFSHPDCIAISSLEICLIVLHDANNKLKINNTAVFIILFL